MQKHINHLLPVLLFCFFALGKNVQAESGFQKIFTEKTKDKHEDKKNEIVEDDHQGNFKFESASNPVKQIQVRNEFPHSLKLNLVNKNNLVDKTIYLNAYEVIKNASIPKGIDYTVEIYDLNNSYMGYLMRSKLKELKTLNVSPFLLIKDKAPKGQEKAPEEKIASKAPEVPKQEENLKEKEKEKKEQTPIDTAPPEPKKVELKKANKIEEADPKLLATNDEPNSNLRPIKVANISDSNIQVEIIDNGSPIAPSWTINNDVYVPEPLTHADQPIKVNENVELKILYLKSNTSISLNAKDLKIDEKNNYIYFVDKVVDNAKL